ncbi:FMN-linked oxidoreductase [Xylona heveae TC161]|uniref:FMN-linked oxidoreductase n=1 Tax=Xylona heveae (strain CBS 132557 / TC161) TaxID=1328760 RepID=A0A165JAL4_XYLHT|nr:FMN-linked oxidoreductase [Xylona heveae TC161]KZF25976.1 FMN-linked oxidoreductase [Xylona heveae TC161]
MLRSLFSTIMTSAPKRVPIPKNGVDYRGKVVLAPMVRSGELPSRLMALKYGADLVWGPETVDRAMIGTTRRINPFTSTIEYTRIPSNIANNPSLSEPERTSLANVIFRIDPAREYKRLIFQMGTASPARAVEAGHIIGADVAGIDVNAGCPKPFSTSGGMGAALLRTPDLLCSILESLVREVGSKYEIGISVKIRILETPELTASLVRRLCQTGITGLTVHCRTTPMRPRERAIRDQLCMVGTICRDHGVACLANGDVEGRDHALELAKEFDVDGAMIATAAERNPSIFRADVDGGPAPWTTVVPEYVQCALEVHNRWNNTKYLLSNMIPGKDAAYKKMSASKCYSDLVQVLGLENLKELAAEVDERLGISNKANINKGTAAAAAPSGAPAVEKAKKANPSAKAAGGEPILPHKDAPKQEAREAKPPAATTAATALDPTLSINTEQLQPPAQSFLDTNNAPTPAPMRQSVSA